jgi:hypothetical protein
MVDMVDMVNKGKLFQYCYTTHVNAQLILRDKLTLVKSNIG